MATGLRNEASRPSSTMEGIPAASTADGGVVVGGVSETGSVSQGREGRPDDGVRLGVSVAPIFLYESKPKRKTTSLLQELEGLLKIQQF